MRGFNQPRKHDVARSWIQALRPSFGSFFETRVQESVSQQILTSILPGWSYITNYDHHRLGRIWVVSSNDVVVTPLFKSSQHITCSILLVSSGIQLVCSFIYASNFIAERRVLWADMCQIRSSLISSTVPWIAIGDFNEILSHSDHSRAIDYSYNGMRDFQNVVSFCDMEDLNSSGPTYTWINNQDANPIGKKLDRALINPNWLSQFPYSYASYEATGISDHSRCMVHLSPANTGHRKPFRFFNFLANHNLFLPTVSQVWSETEPLFHSRAALSLFHQKLKRLKNPLRDLNRTKFGDLPKKTAEAYDLFCSLQNAALADPTSATLEALSEASDRWNKLATLEEQFFKQKSCINWLRCGDQNTSYFHRLAQANASRNAIRTLTTQAGVVLSQPEDIKAEAARHFRTFLQQDDPDFANATPEFLSELLAYRCPPEICSMLVAPITEEEIRNALVSLPSDKASGPDGFTKEFYIAAWSVIGPDFIVAVQSFFLFGLMPKSVNATLLALIPKTPDSAPVTIKDYRPIACCNLLYKVISKILANRLQRTLPDIIELNQSAFVKGRLLLENVLLATELVKDYHKDSISRRCAIKFDISKAFDTVQWQFILSILKVVGFPDLYIHWIYACISTAYFSVVINGELEGFFGSRRGIRQGCSLSPYLFVLVQNVLSRLLNRATTTGEIGKHPRCDQICVSHLSFADDIMVFNDGSPRSIDGTMMVFKEFSRMSGLHINANKSALFVAGRNQLETTEVASAVGLQVETLPIRYLGLPLTTKSMTAHDYSPLIDKIRSRLLSWASKYLSYAGRLQLISSVITSISGFWCSVFRLPARCFDEIERMCGAFLWSGNPNTTTGAKVAWEDICRPKTEGGLGLRRLKDVSRVFAYRLVWRLFSLSGSLWVAWTRQNLFRHGNFWSLPPTTLGSWVWRKLLKLREEIRPFIRAEVRDGATTSFWMDHWLPLGRLLDLTGAAGPRLLGIPLHSMVRDALGTNGWRLRRTRVAHMIPLIELLRAQPAPSPSNGTDQFLWRHGPDDFRASFSTRQTWEQLRFHHPQTVWSDIIWFSHRIPRCGFITWLAMRDRLSTGTRMRSWGHDQPCVLCGERDESRDHLFFACPYSFTVWSEIAGPLLQQRQDPDWEITIATLTAGSGDLLNDILLKLCFQVTIYHLWRERNARIHQSGFTTVPQMTRRVRTLIKNRITSLNYASKPRLRRLLQRWFAVTISST